MILSRHACCHVRRELDYYSFKLSAYALARHLTPREVMAWAHDMLPAVAHLHGCEGRASS